MKPAYIMLSTGILAIVFVTGLFLSSYHSSDVKHGFIRKVDHNSAKKINELDIKYGTYYIGGLSAKYIYLGNYTASLHLLRSDYNLKDTNHIALPVSSSDKVDWVTARIQIDEPNIYLTERHKSIFIAASLPFEHKIYGDLKGVKFDLVKIISPNSIILRTYDGDLNQNILRKVTIPFASKANKFYKPQKQSDGTYSIDGFFNYNKTSNKLFYTYYYRNEFLCLDTNLNLLYIGHTLDTVTSAKINIAQAKNSKTTELLFAAPPLNVNKRGYTDGNRLYINSALASDLETKAEFEDYSVIDVYSDEDGHYHHSIYLPKYNGKRIRDFAVYGQILVALYEHNLVTYQIN